MSDGDGGVTPAIPLTVMTPAQRADQAARARDDAAACRHSAPARYYAMPHGHAGIGRVYSVYPTGPLAFIGCYFCGVPLQWEPAPAYRLSWPRDRLRGAPGA